MCGARGRGGWIRAAVCGFVLLLSSTLSGCASSSVLPEGCLSWGYPKKDVPLLALRRDRVCVVSYSR